MRIQVLCAVNVGHVFLVFTETKPDGSSITRNVGFYPSQNVTPRNSTASGEMNDNSNHGYNISLNITMDASAFTTMLNYVKSSTGNTYDLNSNNCTNFALNTLASAGVNIATANGTWPYGGGKNPGDLGEDIRGMTLPSNMTKSTTSSSHPNTGTCY